MWISAIATMRASGASPRIFSFLNLGLVYNSEVIHVLAPSLADDLWGVSALEGVRDRREERASHPHRPREHAATRTRSISPGPPRTSMKAGIAWCFTMARTCRHFSAARSSARPSASPRPASSWKTDSTAPLLLVRTFEENQYPSGVLLQRESGGSRLSSDAHRPSRPRHTTPVLRTEHRFPSVFKSIQNESLSTILQNSGQQFLVLWLNGPGIQEGGGRMARILCGGE